LVVMAILFSTSALAIVVDKLSSGARGNSVPSRTTNLTEDSDHTYTASWDTVYEYTYTNYKVCSGDSSKKFEIKLSATSWADMGNNAEVDGTVKVTLYNDRGTAVTSWTASGKRPSFTKYYYPSSASAYYYCKIEKISGIGYISGNLYIKIVNK